MAPQSTREQTVADSNARVEDGKIVIIHFTLTDSDGVMIETSVGDEPLPYLHGADNIVDGLEAALDGGAVGDKLSVDLTPADAYGEASGTPEQAVPRDEFPDGVPLEAGMELFTEGSEGEPIPLWITRFDDDSVWITLDHPLAGKRRPIRRRDRRHSRTDRRRARARTSARCRRRRGARPLIARPGVHPRRSPHRSHPGLPPVGERVSHRAVE